jgi:hypothetical protein
MSIGGKFFIVFVDAGLGHILYLIFFFSYSFIPINIAYSSH